MLGSALHRVRRAFAVGAFRRALENGDVTECRKLWHLFHPYLPQAESYEMAEIDLHIARTAAKSVSLHKRLYSHEFLFERGLPSQLPDELRPKMQRRGKSVIFRAVGVAVGSVGAFKEDAKELERVMGEAGGEMLSRGITDPVRISAYMWEKREDFMKSRLRREM